MGKIEIRTGSKERRFAGPDDPLLAGAIHDAAFGTDGRIGAEIEFIVFEPDQAVSLGQAGSTTTPGEFLRRLHAVAGPGAVLATDPFNDYPCGVTLPNGGRFCLENGGQVEYASTPCSGLDALAAELADALALCERAAEGKLRFLGHGTHPTLEARLDPIVPNSRYRIMERFFAPDSIHRWGNYACSIQVNVDVPGREGWVQALRLGFALSRFAYQLFANSAYLHDRREAGPSARLALTRQMDARRRAVPASVVLADDPATAYRDWALDAAVIFAGELPLEEQPRQGELSFRRWLEEGYRQGHPDYISWLAHLGTLWPDVRPRRFIELRAADMQPFEHVMAVVAFWHALIQRPDGRARLADYFTELLPGHTPEAALAAILGQGYDDPVFADSARQDALLALAQDVLADAGEARGAAALAGYRAFAARKATYWDAPAPAAFVQAAVTTGPAGKL